MELTLFSLKKAFSPTAVEELDERVADEPQGPWKKIQIDKNKVSNHIPQHIID
jgi:hypothetical protein